MASLLKRKMHIPREDAREYTLANAADVREMELWGQETANLRLYIPADWVRTVGGWRITSPEHPFMRALRGGKSDLKNFYENFRPRNLRELHGLEGPGPGSDLPAYALPWLLREHRPPPGERHLDASHGTSLYGPGTDAKAELEVARMEYLRRAIGARGYDPHTHGDINGHFILDENRVAFLVRGAKHRAATLAYLGYELIPVTYRRNWPRVVRSDESCHFPLVREGAITGAGARELLSRYF